MSASFQFIVESLQKDWYVVAPDWRGFGLSEWASQGYWFPDYVSDLELIMETFSSQSKPNLVGHSMGGNIAAMYAGINPDNVNSLILAEGFGMPPASPSEAPERLQKWLRQRKSPPTLKPYESTEDVAERLISNTPNLSLERAMFLAKHWARENAQGLFELCADPKHKIVNPILYRSSEAVFFWERIKCNTLWIYSDSGWLDRFLKGERNTIDEYRSRYKNLSEKTIKNSTHMMHHVQPEQFALEIENFIQHKLI